MQLHGKHLIGRGTSAAGSSAFRGVDPASGKALAPEFRDANDSEVDAALKVAAAAHPTFELAGRERRAAFLEDAAARIEGLGDELLERTSSETGLPRARLENERGRTTGQLRAFAGVVRAGDFLDVCIEPGDPQRKPLPRPDLRSMQRALGPVVVFGASNFPLAFSVAGGDTAAALAAGCPVVVKAHQAHPGCSELVGRALVEAARAAELPAGTFSLLHGHNNDVGAALVRHPATRAVAFTGSLAGGRALFDLAAARPEPIPVFAEMGSNNPLFVLHGRLAADGAEIARGLAASITLGVGQFCTRPGLVVLPRGKDAESFLAVLGTALAELPDGTLLHRGIRDGFDRRLAEIGAVQGVEVLVRGEPSPDSCSARAAVCVTGAANFLVESSLHDEVFGPSALVVLYDNDAQLNALVGALGGQLTATLHAAESDLEAHPELVGALEQKVGRLLFGGYPTGVEVSPAMVHGGPYPATTDARSTSVGSAAIRRFTRPLCYQNWPPERLPVELRG